MKTAVVIGLGTGVLTSVAPFELMAFPPVIAFAVLAVKRNRRGMLAALVAFVAVCWAAVEAPMKWADRNSVRELPDRCVTIDEVQRAMGGVPATTLDRRVCFSTRTPTYREISDVLTREVGLEVHVLTCGSGASLLLGGEPMGRPFLTTAAR